jgi:hypothetical protein
MLPELKDAVLDHLDYRGAVAATESTRGCFEYSRIRKNSAVTVLILANSATRQQLGIHHVNAPASALGASRFIDEVADLAWVFDPGHGHNPSAWCVSVR